MAAACGVALERNAASGEPLLHARPSIRYTIGDVLLNCRAV